jgi:hypothetical protein
MKTKTTPTNDPKAIFRVRLAIPDGVAEYGSFPTYSAAVESAHEKVRPILDFHPGWSTSAIAPEDAEDGITVVIRANDGTMIVGFGIIARFW